MSIQSAHPGRVLASVTDKRNLHLFRELTETGWGIYSTGGTATALKEAHIPVTFIEDYTGMPEMMDGRLKTLHPKVFGGILADRDKESHMKAVRDGEMVLFDIVAVNLYDFATDPCIEKIDIGGPSQIRAAAKNSKFVTVLVDPADYELVITEILTLGHTKLSTRRHLAKKAFRYCWQYDKMIDDKMTDEWFDSQVN